MIEKYISRELVYNVEPMTYEQAMEFRLPILDGYPYDNGYALENDDIGIALWVRDSTFKQMFSPIIDK